MTAPTITSVVTTVAGLSVTLTFAATDPEGLAGAVYAVTWGDGQSSSGAAGSFSHTYASNGIYPLLLSVTDSTAAVGYAAAAVEALGAGAGLGVGAITAMMESHALRLGIFSRVNKHEPKNAPSGLVASIWAAYLGPALRQSGLTSTTALLIFNVRITTNMLGEPQDGIDITVLNATDALFAAYSGDFDLGGTVRNVDLLGANGTPLAANAGYLPQDNKMLRAMVISVPLIVNDVWSQAS